MIPITSMAINKAGICKIAVAITVKIRQRIDPFLTLRKDILKISILDISC